MNLGGSKEDEEKKEEKPKRVTDLAEAEETIRILYADIKEHRMVNDNLIKALRDKQNLIDELKMGTLPVGKVMEMVDEHHALVRFGGGDASFRVVIEPMVVGKVDVGTRVVCSTNRGAILFTLAPEKDAMATELQLVEYPKLSYSDVLGLDDQLKSLRSSIEFVLSPSLNNRRRNMVHDPSFIEEAGSVLLFGPPGVGKTYSAKAVAASIADGKVGFLKVEGYELVSKWLGESAKNVKELFKVARDVAPSVVFIDEVDAITRERQETSTDAGRDIQGMLNQLLTEMGGFKSNNNVAIIFATNFPQVIDRAILDRVKNILYIPPPRTPGEVRRVIDYYITKIKMEPLNDNQFSQIWEILKTRKMTYEVQLPSRGIAVRETYCVTPRDVKNIALEVVGEAAFEGEERVSFDRLLARFKKATAKEKDSKVFN